MADLVKIVGKEDFGFQPYPSYYNVFNPLLRTNFAGVPAKQHFIEACSGSAVRTDIWTIGLDASASITMGDEINGGMHFQTGGSGSIAGCVLDQGDIHHYEPTGMAFTIVFRTQQTGGDAFKGGFGNPILASDIQEGTQVFIDAAASTNVLLSNHNGPRTNVDTGIGRDTIFHRWDGVVSSTNSTLKDSGSLVATNTGNLPDQKAQMGIWAHSRESTNFQMNMTYFEAFNT